jgi:phosphoribosylformylglycinamidine (FGAM) synthase-like enzyme
VIGKFTVRPASPGPGADLLALRRALGLPDLHVWHDYYLEYAEPPTPEQTTAILAALADEIATTATVGADLGPGMVQVAHRAGIVDNESASLVAMCELLGVRAIAGKTASTYVASAPRLAEVIAEHRCNTSIEELHITEPRYASLLPAGAYAPAQRYDLTAMGEAELAELGRRDGRNLDPAQMAQLRHVQRTTGAAEVTDVLLEAMDARWSDHCAHTTWRSLGRLLDRLVAASRDTGNPNIVSMFTDNAGVWDFYAGAALNIKAETHNGPSAVAAYFGQLTKVGGVLRDIMGTGQGADPIGTFEYTATGLPDAPAPIKGRPSPRQIAADTVRAVKEYGNTFGVPMMTSRMTFHPAYRAKPFALGGSVGILPRALAEQRRPRPGDLVVLIGGLTGNEGIHGASASSAGSAMDTAAVQIGAPLEQVKFRKAIVDLRDAGCLRTLTDLGAAGINSAAGELGDPGGVWLNTALVPLKTSALPMWRILLSESQERMLLAVPPPELAAARDILGRHQVRTTVIGRFVDSGRYCVLHDPELTEADVVAAPVGEVPVPSAAGELGFDLPYALAGWSPPQRIVGPPPELSGPAAVWPPLAPASVADALAWVVSDLEVASQLAADQQYDSTVQGNTLYGPHFGSRHRAPAGYWAGRPVPDSPAAAVLSTAFNPWLYDLDPGRALRQLFCGLLGRQVLAGVDLADICVCDNFYTPHLAPLAAEWLVAMVDELAALVRCFGTPVISGKDSSAGSTETDEGVVSVPPAVFLTALGKVPDAAALLPEAWQRPGRVLVRVGPTTGSVAGTVAARRLGIEGGVLDDVDPEAYRGFLAALASARPVVHSGQMLGPGGLAARLVVTAIAGELGVDLDPALPVDDGLLAEHRCAAVIEVDESDVDGLPAELTPLVVGRVSAERGVRYAGGDLLAPNIEDRWLTSFEQVLA